MNYSYLRVSTNKQDVENQKYGILQYADQKNIKKLVEFADSESSKVNWKKRGIGELINERAKKGDVIIIAEVSRAARTILEILEFGEACIKKGVSLHIAKLNLVLDGSMNSKIQVFMMGMMAEIERELIRSRTAESLQKRKAEIKEKGYFISKDGKKIKNLGRPKGKAENLKLDAKRDEILDLLEKGINKASIAKFVGCSRSTLYDWFKRNKIK